LKRTVRNLKGSLQNQRAVLLSASLGCLVLAAVLYLGWRSQEGVGHTGSAFGKRVHIQVWANYLSQPAHLHLASSLYEQAREVQRHIWLEAFPESELALFNRGSQPGPYTVPEVVVHTLEKIAPTIKPTLGMADPTLKPLMDTFWPTDLAYSKRREPATPEASELALMRAYLGLDKVRWTLDPPTLEKKHPNVYLNLEPWYSSVLAEQFEAVATREKVTGLEVLTPGLLHVWMQSPMKLTSDAQAQIAKLAIAQPLTISGAFSWIDIVDVSAKRSANAYFQTVDPKTLHAVESDVSAVAVFCRSGLVSTTWARASLVLGSERTLALANRHGIPVRIRTKNAKVVTTSAWQNLAEGTADPGTAFCTAKL
jgi:FAD:protein FMN transferase